MAIKEYLRFLFTPAATSEEIDRLQDEKRLEIYFILREKAESNLDKEVIASKTTEYISMDN